MKDTPPLDQLQRPIRDLRISVIDRCNFRCPYCMPEEKSGSSSRFAKKSEWLSFKDIIRLTKAFVACGVQKVRLTGGEPLLRPQLSALVKEMAGIAMIDDLALTTNGFLLADYAQELKVAGLQRLTISLDALDSRVFHVMTGRKGQLAQVLLGVEAAEKAGFPPLKINIVIQKGVNDHQIIDMLRYFSSRGHILRFIEYMDVGNCNHWDSRYVVPSKEIVEHISRHFELEALRQNYFGEVAQRYLIKEYQTEIGLVSSISQPFCRSCTRARLSTQGMLFTCLFSAKGTDLRPYLTHPSDSGLLEDKIRKIWTSRSDRYSELREQMRRDFPSQKKVEMFHIGG